MKIRNKATGEEVYAKLNITEDEFRLCETKSRHHYLYRTISLDEFIAEWEDCTSAEPLIKDEKIRKAVRAWWKTIPDAITDKRVLYKKSQDLAVGVYTIYCGAIYPETLEVGKIYTIAELCGEEEK